MSTIVLGVGDLAATAKLGDVIKTIGLGSCIAVIILDPHHRCIGMDHIALPDSSVSPERARQKPGHFADTGIPMLIEEMKRAGSNGSRNGMIVKLVGGATVLDPNGTFNIGKRNLLAIKKILWQYGMGAVAEAVGGHMSRTVTVDVESGLVRITSPGREAMEL